MSGRVIVVGSVNIDLVARVPHLPRPGETVTGGSYARHQGGKGGNQAVAAARLRRPTLLVGAVGDDPFASEARRALVAERVDVSMVTSLAGQATGVALILVDQTGENEIAVVPGANGEIEHGHVRDCLNRLGRLVGDVVLVCNEVPLGVVREALVCGRAAGATTILNPAPAVGIDRTIFGLADIITPNRNELGTLLQTEAKRTGHRSDASQEIAVRARTLLDGNPDAVPGDVPGVRKAVIVTLGASGVVVLEQPGSGLEGRKPAVPAAAASEAAPAAAPTPAPAYTAAPGAEPAPDNRCEDVVAAADAAAAQAEPEPEEIRVWEAPAERVATVDTTGAGDAFNGALAAAIAEGRSFAEAVRRAIVAGALTTTQAGAREGMPTLVELERYLSSH